MRMESSEKEWRRFNGTRVFWSITGKVIYFEARLIEGLPIDNPTEMSNLMCDIMADK